MKNPDLKSKNGDFEKDREMRTAAGFRLEPVLELPDFVNVDWLKEQNFEGFPALVRSVTSCREELERISGFAEWPETAPDTEEAYHLMVSAMRFPLFLRAFFRLGRINKQTGAPRGTKYTAFKKLIQQTKMYGCDPRDRAKVIKQKTSMHPDGMLKVCHEGEDGNIAGQYVWISLFALGEINYGELKQKALELEKGVNCALCQKIAMACDELRFAPFDWDADIIESRDDTCWLPDGVAPDNWDSETGFWKPEEPEEEPEGTGQDEDEQGNEMIDTDLPEEDIDEKVSAQPSAAKPTEETTGEREDDEPSPDNSTESPTEEALRAAWNVEKKTLLDWFAIADTPVDISIGDVEKSLEKIRVITEQWQDLKPEAVDVSDLVGRILAVSDSYCIAIGSDTSEMVFDDDGQGLADAALPHARPDLEAMVVKAETALAEVEKSATEMDKIPGMPDWQSLIRKALDRSDEARRSCRTTLIEAFEAFRTIENAEPTVSADVDLPGLEIEQLEELEHEVPEDEEAFKGPKEPDELADEDDVTDDENGEDDADDFLEDGIYEDDESEMSDIEEVAEPEDFPHTEAPDDLQESDQSEVINVKLKDFFGKGEFGAAYHLRRAAGLLNPDGKFAFDQAELRLIATSGFVSGMPYSEIEITNAALGEANIIANTLVSDASVDKDLGQARRIALFTATIEMALFGGGADFRGAMDLIHVLTTNGVGNCFYDLYRAADMNRSEGFPLTTSNLYGAASNKLREHAGKLAENIEERLQIFKNRRVGFSVGEAVRNWMCANKPICDLINAFQNGVGERKARSFAGHYRDWKSADAFVTLAEKESRVKQVIHSNGRERFVRDLTEIADLCAGWVDTLDAMNPNNTRGQVVKKLAERINSASKKAISELEDIKNEGGELVGAAANIAEEVIGRLNGLATGTVAPLKDSDQPLRVLNGPLLWLPGLAFGEESEPVPYEADRIIDGLLAESMPLRDGRRDEATYRDAIENKIREGSFIGARMLVDVGSHYGIGEDVCTELRRRLDAETPIRRDSVREELEVMRRVVVRAQRFATESSVELVDLADQLDEIDVDKLGEVGGAHPGENGSEKLADFISVERRILNIKDQVADILAVPSEEIRDKIDRAVAENKLDDDGVKDIERRLDDGDFATAEEMIEHAVGGHVSKSGIIRPTDFDDFYPRVPQTLSNAEIDLDDVKRAIEEKQDYLGLRFSAIEERQEALDILERWAEFKRMANGPGRKPNDIVNMVSSMLEAMGIRNDPRGFDKDKSSTARKIYVGGLAMSLRRDDEEKSVLLPDFGSIAQGGWRLCVFQRRPNRDEVMVACDVPQHMGTLIFVPQVISDQARDEDARRMIEAGYKGLVIDEALFLFALAQQRFRALTMFEIAQSFSYANPFGDRGDEPVPEEMFVGRREEIETVKALDKGFFVFGGRRLGKTALLQFVNKRENRPEEGRISAYVSLQQMTRASNVWEEASRKLADIFGRKLATSGGEFSEGVKKWLKADPKRTILLFLDEANEYVREDAAREYQEFRQFQKLMYDTNRRLKVVFAGLQNLARIARNSENQPVSHFDSAVLAIGPFMGDDVRYAETLITRPLAGLGYRFENDDDVWRILSFCNYYPILIQLFGENMVRALRERVRTEGRIERVIDTDLVTEVLEDRQTLRAIHDAIDKTLQLDGYKYQLLAYILAENMMNAQERGISDEGLTARDVRASAASYWPAAFSSEDVSTDMVDGLLEEMEVLGLLRKTSRTRRTLRSRSTLMFLGSSDVIIETLLAFEDKPAPKTFDPHLRRRNLDKRGKKDTSAKRSPLTTGQEFDLLKRDGDSVRMVLGNEASGIGSVQKALVKAPMTQDGMGIQLNSCDAKDEKGLQRQILRVNLAPGGKRHVIVVPHTFNWNRGWVRAARSLKPVREGRVQVIFVGGPRNAYEWVRRDIASEDMAVINLVPWRYAATETLLRGCHIVEAEELAREVHAVTGGWNSFMDCALPEGITGKKTAEESLAEFKAKLEDRTDLDMVLGVGEITGIPPSCMWALREAAKLAAVDELFTQDDIAATIDLVFQDDGQKPSARIVLDFALALGLVETQDINEERRGTPREKIKRRFNDLVLQTLIDMTSSETVEVS